MSLLANQSYANPSRPLWAPFGSSGGGSTGPTGPSGSTGATGATGPSGGGGGSVRSQTLLFQVGSLVNGGGPATPFDWTDRPLNLGNPALDGSGNSQVISGMSLNLSNSQITLPSGTYTYSGTASLDMTVGQACVNILSPSTSKQYGCVSSTDSRTFVCPFQGSLTGPCVFTVQTNGQTTFGTDRDLGTAAGFDSNVYCAITVNKIG